MLFKNIKILLLIAIYSVFLLLLFSETFLSDFQEIRRSVVMDIQNQKTTTLILPKTTWDSFSDQHEFKYNGDYYDTKSFVCENQTVKVKVIKDSFEIILKNISKNSNSKNKKNNSFSCKKIIDFYFSKIPSIDWFSINDTESTDFYHLFALQNNYSFSLFRPPLFT